MKYVFIIGLLVLSLQSIAQHDIYDPDNQRQGRDRDAFIKFLADSSAKKPHVGDLYGGGIVVYTNLLVQKNIPDIKYTVFGLIMSLNDVADSVVWDTAAAKKYTINGYSDWFMPHYSDLAAVVGVTGGAYIRSILQKEGTPLSSKYKYWAIGYSLVGEPHPISFNAQLNTSNFYHQELISAKYGYADKNDHLRLRLFREF